MEHLHPRHVDKINELADSFASTIKVEAQRLGKNGAISQKDYNPDGYLFAKILIAAAVPMAASILEPVPVEKYAEEIKNLQNI